MAGGDGAVGSARPLSMIPKKPAPDLIRGANRFSETIMLLEHDRLGLNRLGIPKSGAL
jgi:hypothetical protein